MSGVAEKPNPFDGINGKMARADEHISRLRLEIGEFLGAGAFVEGRIPDDGSKEAKRLVREHRKRKVPMRIRVLAGEAIHQIRSTLDHAMWVLAMQNTGKPRSSTQFPIFEKRPPLDPDDSERRRWLRQTAGLNADGLDFMDGLQPYNLTTPNNDGLWILKTLNDADKHRTVLLTTAATVTINELKFQDGFVARRVDEGERKAFEAAGIRVTQWLVPIVAFPTLGATTNAHVTEALWGLHGYVGWILFKMKERFFPELLDPPEDPSDPDLAELLGGQPEPET